jgi:hypothetical protein
MAEMEWKPKPVKRPVTPRQTAEDTLRRYPRIMAALASPPKE